MSNSSGSRTALKVVSIIIIIFALLSVIAGIALMAGSSLPGFTTSVIEVEGEVFVMSDTALAFGVMGIINGIVYFIIGFLGWRGANKPARIGPFFWLAVIGLVLAIISLIMDIMSGASLAPATVIQIILIVVCVFLAYNIRKNYRGIGM